MNKLAYTILYVLDVEKSMQFYQQAFGFEMKFITPEKDYGELITGTTSLAFANHDLALSNLKEGYQKSNKLEKPFGIELGIVCEDVNESLKLAISHGASIVEEPIQKAWGQTVAYVRDIDGFLVELCTAMS